MLSARPLAIDDLLAFTIELPGGERMAGRARVLREDLPRTYGLRFEELGAEKPRSPRGRSMFRSSGVAARGSVRAADRRA